jgi:hypothetical protein
MQKLKNIIEKYSRWQPLYDYINRIEGYRETDFSLCIENSKALLESIAKEICIQKNQPLENTENVRKLLSLSFGCLGYHPSGTIRQIGTAVANIGQQMGNFRNEIGTTAHGKTLEQLVNREQTINSLTNNFLIFSTELVCCFLIECFESDNYKINQETEIDYSDNENFNEYWDEMYGEFTMSEYSFPASEILFAVDPEAYMTELINFIQFSVEPDIEYEN